jgi:hypothetical protein
MNNNNFIVVVVLLAVTATACRQKRQPTRVEEPNPQSPDLGNVDERVSDLQRYAVELTALSKNLPGRDKSEDRRLLADSFDRATSALTLLMGPEPHGAFRQQLRIIDNVRRDVRSGNASDATVDSGMRSIYNALVGIRDRLFATDDRVRGQLDTLRDRVDDLDSVRGPLHSVAVASAYQASAAVIETMSAGLEGRAAEAATTQATTLSAEERQMLDQRRETAQAREAEGGQRGKQAPTQPQP